MTRFFKKRRLPNFPGFILIEVLIAFCLIGILMQGSLTLMKVVRHHRQFLETRQRSETLLRILALYAAEQGRLPWASSLDPSSSQFGKEEISYPLSQGGIPFKTLGLTETDAKDGFGNPFLYAVATTRPAAFPNNPLDAYCRAHPARPLLHPNHLFEDRPERTPDFLMVAICSAPLNQDPSRPLFPWEETEQGILLPEQLPRGSFCVWTSRSLLMARYAGVSCVSFSNPSPTGAPGGVPSPPLVRPVGH